MNREKSTPDDVQYRIEKDSLGTVKVPIDALYGAQTQRAVKNFPISGLRFHPNAITSIALLKSAAAEVNTALGLLDTPRGEYIQRAADDIATGIYNDQFPVDIFMTGSGTSFNMNANEVISQLAQNLAREEGNEINIHPNDHVNLGQSSNDVIPSVLHLATLVLLTRGLIPALQTLESALDSKATELSGIVKTGRTHLMDALPIMFSDELGGWKAQIANIRERLIADIPHLGRIALGGTAVGTGLNSGQKFAGDVCTILSEKLQLPIEESRNHFASQSSMDELVNYSSQLKTLASALMKIANDIRLMNSGPHAGLSEIAIKPLQPGSSIMPGKINPVICEAVMQVCAQVIGNDVTVTIGNERGNFQLNTMLPVIGHNVWQSTELLTHVIEKFAAETIIGFSVELENVESRLTRNPMLVTALAPHIGYNAAAAIARQAYNEKRSVIEVARENTSIDEGELRKILAPARLAEGNKKNDIADKSSRQ